MRSEDITFAGPARKLTSLGASPELQTAVGGPICTFDISLNGFRTVKDRVRTPTRYQLLVSPGTAPAERRMVEPTAQTTLVRSSQVDGEWVPGSGVPVSGIDQYLPELFPYLLGKRLPYRYCSLRPLEESLASRS